MANKRIFYAIEQVGIKNDADAGQFNALHGVQSCGITTNFNLNQVFELGQIAIYANIEDLPDVQITLSKVLDGYPLIYHRATVGATAPTLVGRSTCKCVVALAIFPDTNTSATGAPGSMVEASGQFVSSAAYRFNVDDNGTEEVSLVGNNKIWKNDSRILSGETVSITFSGAFTSGADVPAATVGISRRQHVVFTPTVFTTDSNGQITDPDCTILPIEVEGINSSGVNVQAADSTTQAHVQTLGVNVDFNRTALNELGHLAPYTRYINFPVQVTTEIGVISASGDLVSATEKGIYTTGSGCGAFQGNLRNNTIRIATCEGTRIYCGLKNKLQSINYTGGDTGGGNVQVTYSYRNFNDFTVMHSGDPHASGAAWWTARATYLCN